MRTGTLGEAVHAAVGWSIYVVTTAMLAGLLLAGALVPPRPNRFQLGAMRWFWGRLLWGCVPFWSRRITGLEHVGNGPYVVVSNHGSVLDVPACLGLPVPLRICARPGIFHVPVMGFFLSLTGQIEADALLEEGPSVLDAGHSVLVFPEGSRSVDGRVGRFHRGAFTLARSVGVEVLPVAISGTRHILPKRRVLPTRVWCPVEVRVLPPVGIEPEETDRAYARRVRRRIVDALEDS